MISFEYAKKFCNEDLSLIENFDNAIADKEQTWHCHHRRELETSRKELIEIGEYYNRPANELIFLTKSEHNALHNTLKFKGKKRKPFSEEWKRNISLALKGKTPWMKGKHLSEEAKRKISEAKKGRHLSEESKRHMSDSLKGRKLTEEHKKNLSKHSTGRHWFNNGIKNVFLKECPEGFVKGTIKRKPFTEETRKKISEARKGQTSWNKGIPHTEEAKRKMSIAQKGLHWFNNGIINIKVKECPEGFVKGRLKKVKQI